MQHNEDPLLIEINNVLRYFVLEGIAQEVSPGRFALTPEGKNLVAPPAETGRSSESSKKDDC